LNNLARTFFFFFFNNSAASLPLSSVAVTVLLTSPLDPDDDEALPTLDRIFPETVLLRTRGCSSGLGTPEEVPASAAGSDELEAVEREPVEPESRDGNVVDRSEEEVAKVRSRSVDDNPGV